MYGCDKLAGADEEKKSRGILVKWHLVGVSRFKGVFMNELGLRAGSAAVMSGYNIVVSVV